MKTLLKDILARLGRSQTPSTGSESVAVVHRPRPIASTLTPTTIVTAVEPPVLSPLSTTPLFDSLSPVEQETVNEYFAAARQLVDLFDAIRLRQRATDADEVLEAFQKAEYKYIWMGMRTIFPPASRCVSSLDPEALTRKGLLARIATGEKAIRFAPAMARQLKKLRVKFHPVELDSHIDRIPGAR